MKVLKEEISRIARSEVNAALKPIKSVNASQRKYIADLRRRIELLEKEKKQLEKTISKAVPVEEAATEETASRGWITSAGIRSMRKRLKLSQKAFAELAGVSLPTVVNWESSKNSGKLNIRKQEVFDRLQQIKGMGVRDLEAAAAEQE
jgi:DNA-binding transcriptional regulator YiaG